MMCVMSECVEYQRLQRAYDDAIVVWEQDRHPIDRQKLTYEAAAKLRAQALVKRNIAANELYTHLRTCPTCSRFKG
jgi:NMD protein affecting ribosome stability and mRNA decay